MIDIDKLISTKNKYEIEIELYLRDKLKDFYDETGVLVTDVRVSTNQRWEFGGFTAVVDDVLFTLKHREVEIR
jgi:hypothetical protein